MTQELVSIKNTHWLFVSKYTKTYTKEKLKGHLDELFPNNRFIIEDVPFRENYQFKSFKIGVDKNCKDNLLNEEIWPDGVEVSEYDFFRKSKYKIYQSRRHIRQFPTRKK